MTDLDCPPHDDLTAFCASRVGDPQDGSPAAGAQGEETRTPDRDGLLQHLAGCRACRVRLAAIGLDGAVESPAEAARLDRLLGRLAPIPLPGLPAGRLGGGGGQEGAASDPLQDPRPAPAPLRALRGKARRAGWAGLAAAVAAAAVAIALRPGTSTEELLAPLAEEGRPIEGALSAWPVAPFRPRRGAGPERNLDRPLHALLDAQARGRPGAERALATIFLARRAEGDLDHVGRALDALLDVPGGTSGGASGGPPVGPQDPLEWALRASDRAALRLETGALVDALEDAERALDGSPGLALARFNRGLILARLGLPESAREEFGALASQSSSPWAPEAEQRRRALDALLAAPSGTSPTPGSPQPLAALRRSLLSKVLSAADPAGLAAVRAELSRQPAGVAEDLAAIAARREGLPALLDLHARGYGLYKSVRAEVVAGRATRAQLDGLIAAAAQAPGLLPMAVELAAYERFVRGDLRESHLGYLWAAKLCAEGPCPIEAEAIALDELAEAAGRDGDFQTAASLQAKAQERLAAIGATLQLGELQAKRAALLAAQERLSEAIRAGSEAVALLAPRPGDPGSTAARGLALARLGHLALVQGAPRAAAALHRAGLALVAGAELPDVALELSREAALDAGALGRTDEAIRLLRAELYRQEKGRHALGALSLRALLAELLLDSGDPAAARREAEAALQSQAAGAQPWGDTPIRLHLLRARTLLAKGEPERGELAKGELAKGELETTVALAERSIAASPDPVQAWRRGRAGRAGRSAAAELAAAAARAGEGPAHLLSALAPVERLRRAAFDGSAPGHPAQVAAPADPAGARLPEGGCLVGWLPRDRSLLRLTLAGGSAAVDDLPLPLAQLEEQVAGFAPRGRQPARTDAGTRLSAALFAQLPAACRSAGSLWLLAEPPLDRIDLTALPADLPPLGPLHSLDPATPLGVRRSVGVVSTLASLAQPEPAWPAGSPGPTLFLHGAAPEGPLRQTALPAAEEVEREALQRALGLAPLVELSGSRATPEALLGRLGEVGFLHAAVHGAAGSEEAGGFLLLSGPAPRLTSSEIGKVRLKPGARVVLAACESASPGGRLPWAFVRAGAGAVLAASGEVDDAAAARWTGSFTAALARGASTARANQEALEQEATQPAGSARAWFVLYR